MNRLLLIALLLLLICHSVCAKGINERVNTLMSVWNFYGAWTITWR